MATSGKVRPGLGADSSPQEAGCNTSPLEPGRLQGDRVRQRVPSKRSS